MRELDELLLNYLEQRYELAPDTEKAAFCALLELPDPDLVGYLLRQESPVPEVRIVVDYILERVHR